MRYIAVVHYEIGELRYLLCQRVISQTDLPIGVFQHNPRTVEPLSEGLHNPIL